VKIHDFPFAPNPRKLRTYLVEKGLEIPFVIVYLVNGEHQSEEFLAKNPFGKLPLLELDDGSYLSESLAIIEYLEELHPDPPMIGTTPIERARTRRLERIAETGVLNKVAQFVHNTKSPLGKPPNSEVANQALDEMLTPLAVLDAELAAHAFVAGDTPTIADCTLFAACEFARFADLDVPAIGPGFPQVRRWHDEFAKRPSAEVGFQGRVPRPGQKRYHRGS